MKLLGFFWPFVKRRSLHLGLGTLAAIGMVILRLVLPWPLAKIVGPWVKGKVTGDLVDTALGGGALFFGIFVALGCCDYFARVWYARFAVDLVVDLRAAAPPALGKGRGDHLARMIGDTARLKEGLKGFLIHVATNGLLCIGLVVILARLDIWLAAIFGLGLVVIAGLSWFFTKRVSRRAKRLRKREGRLANAIHDAHGETSSKAKRRASRGPQVKPSREHPNATLTVLQGQATWTVHGVLAVMILGCLAIGGPDGARPLSERDLIVFMTYMLHVYHPVVRLARQLTRLGKLEACASRIRTAFVAEAPQASEVVLPALERSVIWRDFGIRAGNRGGGGMRLGPLNLELEKGQRVAVVGPSGSGKTTLLETLTRRSHAKSDGQLMWDGHEMSDLPTKVRSQRVGSKKHLKLPDALAGLDVLCVDDGLEGADAAAQLDALFAAAAGRLLLVSMRRPQQLERFDRVIHLRAGRPYQDAP